MSSDLAPYNPDALPIRRSVTAGKLVDADVWTTYANIAQNVANTEFVPPGLRNKPQSILAALLYGHDLGLGPMVALREITMIDGKPALSAALVTARVRQAGHRMEWRQIIDADGEFLGVTAMGERQDGSKGEYTFTLKMAQRAGLMRANGPYFKYPESMCWARAATQLARMLFSDVFLGHATYAPEELGGDVEDADVVMEIEVRPVSGASPADSAGNTEPSESTAGPPASSSQPDLGGPAASTPAGSEGAPASSEPSPFQQPGSVPLDPRNSPCVLFDGRTSQARTLKKLDITVTQGRDEGLFDTLTVHAVAFELAADLIGPASEYVDDTGEVRYSLLRKVLPMWLASQMIDKLEVQADFARLAS